MRKVFVISMLTLFLVSWLKPYLPYLDYAINKEYIAENLCENKAKPELKCDGKCHLKKEVEKVVEESEKEPLKPHTPYKAKIKINLIVQYIETSFVLDVLRREKIKFSNIDDSIELNFEDIPTPPPQA